jgi:hypothetical protein
LLTGLQTFRERAGLQRDENRLSDPHPNSNPRKSGMGKYYRREEKIDESQESGQETK